MVTRVIENGKVIDTVACHVKVDSNSVDCRKSVSSIGQIATQKCAMVSPLKLY